MAASTSYSHRGCNNTQGDKFRRYTNQENGTLIGLSCTECLSQWVTSDYVTAGNRGSEVIRAEGKTFHSIEKPGDEDESTFSSQSTKITDLDNLADYLTAGDHITYKFHWLTAGLYHHVIVRDVERRAHSPDLITLIHWQLAVGPDNPIPSGINVMKEPVVNMKAKASVIYKCRYGGDSIAEDDKTLTLARAEAWVGETGYSLTQRNCEHFAVFCKTGRHRSFQSEKATEIVSEFVRGMIDYTDELVGKITDLSMGDHVVMYMTLIHPRCHMIVTSVDAEDGVMEVIRFTYEKGVVEEKLKFRKPVHRVISDDAFSPREVIRRARHPTVMKDYNILSFNCKHFAFWCKTGTIPKTP